MKRGNKMTIEKIKEKLNIFMNEHKKDTYFEDYKRYNFVGYNGVDNQATPFKTYEEAKNYAVSSGTGYVLVINTEKIYTYKPRTNADFRKDIIKDNLRKRDFYGI